MFSFIQLHLRSKKKHQSSRLIEKAYIIRLIIPSKNNIELQIDDDKYYLNLNINNEGIKSLGGNLLAFPNPRSNFSLRAPYDNGVFRTIGWYDSRLKSDVIPLGKNVYKRKIGWDDMGNITTIMDIFLDKNTIYYASFDLDYPVSFDDLSNVLKNNKDDMNLLEHGILSFMYQGRRGIITRICETDLIGLFASCDTQGSGVSNVDQKRFKKLGACYKCFNSHTNLLSWEEQEHYKEEIKKLFQDPYHYKIKSWSLKD